MVLIPTAVVSLVGCCADVAIPTSAPVWALLLGAAVIGIGTPPLASASRSIWPFLLRDPNILEAAYVTDATFQELVFIVGPLLVVAVIAVAGSGSAILAAACSAVSARWCSRRAAVRDAGGHSSSTDGGNGRSPRPASGCSS